MDLQIYSAYGNFIGNKIHGTHTHMLHVWYIYLYIWLIFRANVGKYSIHGAYGMWNLRLKHNPNKLDNNLLKFGDNYLDFV